MRARKTNRHFAYLALAVATSSCAASGQTGAIPGPRITHVDVKGQAELDKEDILEHISLRPSRWLGEKYFLFPGADRIAQRRLTELYHAEGYYQAQVLPIQASISRQDKPIARQRAKLSITIHAGQPTTIASIAWQIQDLPQALARVVKTASALSKGQRFSVSAFNQAKQNILGALQEAGYPDAKVQESAKVDRHQRQAALHFDIQPGAHVTVSSVSIEGTSSVPKRFIQQIASDAVGQPYSPQRIAQIESEIYALGIFSSVHTTLKPTRDPNQRRLHIDLARRDPSQLALGVTAHFDSTIWSQRLGFRYQHNNILQRLAQLKLSVSAGWAEMPVSSGKWHSSPLLEADVHLSKPSLRDPKLRWFIQSQALTQPREGYELWRAQLKLGATRNLGTRASIALSYNASWLSIYTISSARKPSTQGIDALEGQRPFLSYLEAQLQYFDLDQRMGPKQGVHALLTYQWASRFLGSQSEYQRIVPELRAYWNPISWLVVAGRTRVGFILPFGQKPGARIDQRFYLGGVGSMRGWPLRALSPFVTLCDQATPQRCIDIPYGGNSEFLANLELRFNVWKSLDLVALADAGDVRSQTASIRPGQLSYTAGGGLRYLTPIGAIRLDIGYQLNHDLARFRKTRPFAVHLALGDSF